MKSRLASTAVLFLTFVAADVAAAEGMPEPVRKQIDKNFIGEWTAVTVYDGVTSKGTYTAQWSQGNHCVIIHEAFSGPDGDVHISGILGWDAQDESILHQGFISGGDCFTIRYGTIAGDKWTGRITGTYEARHYESPAMVEWEGDRFEYRDTMAGKPFVFKAERR
jgi:hypothetical protein